MNIWIKPPHKPNPFPKSLSMASEEDPHGHLSKEPCSVCTSSPYRQGKCRYKSNVKCFSEAGTHGYWHLGEKYILKDRDMLTARDDADNLEFIQCNTTIPVPKILDSWEHPGGRYLTIEEYIKDGTSLSAAWPSLSESDREDIAQQTVDYLKQLRSHTKEKVQSINGGPVTSYAIFKDYDAWAPVTTHGPFESDDQIFEAMTADLKKKKFPEKVLAEIRKHMPPSKPYTLTHTLLHYDNIILRGKKVVGITDWDGAAYLPCWAEYIFARQAFSEGDQEWRNYLVPKLGQYKEVKDQFYLLRNFANYPDLDDVGWDLLKKIEAVADDEAQQRSTDSAAGEQ